MIGTTSINVWSLIEQPNMEYRLQPFILKVVQGKIFNKGKIFISVELKWFCTQGNSPTAQIILSASLRGLDPCICFVFPSYLFCICFVLVFYFHCNCLYERSSKVSPLQPGVEQVRRSRLIDHQRLQLQVGNYIGFLLGVELIRVVSCFVFVLKKTLCNRTWSCWSAHRAEQPCLWRRCEKRKN